MYYRKTSWFSLNIVLFDIYEELAEREREIEERGEVGEEEERREERGK